LSTPYGRNPGKMARRNGSGNRRWHTTHLKFIKYVGFF